MKSQLFDYPDDVQVPLSMRKNLAEFAQLVDRLTRQLDDAEDEVSAFLVDRSEKPPDSWMTEPDWQGLRTYLGNLGKLRRHS